MLVSGHSTFFGRFAKRHSVYHCNGQAQVLKAGAPVHPCVLKGMSSTHIRVFHNILSGFDQGHNPRILQDLIDHDLIRARRTGYLLPHHVYADWSDWLEYTTKVMSE